MRLLLDNNLSPKLVALLTEAGHDAIHVRDNGLASADDTEVLALAVETGRVVVSADTDFGTLLASTQATSPSFVLVRRVAGRRVAELGAVIIDNLPVVEEELAAGAVVVFGDTSAGASAPLTSTAGGPSSRGDAPLADHVVLVACDGFDAKYLERGVPTPNVDALARRGSISTSTGVMASITNPSWSSVATGAFPERTSNTAYWYDRSADVVRGQSRDIAVETLGQSLRSSGRSLASVQWFIEQDKSVFYGDPDALYVQPGGDCDNRVDQAVALLDGQAGQLGWGAGHGPGGPDFLGVYCGDLDAEGHRVGADAPVINETLAALDKDLGRLVQATKDADIYGRTLFLLTGDHGMKTFDKAFGSDILAAIDRAGYQGEFVGTDRAPAAGTDVVLAVGGVASAHLGGDALTDPDAAARIEQEVSRIPQVAQVLDRAEQRELRMSPRLGELVIEPEEGWTTAPTAPAAPAGLHGTTQERPSPFCSRAPESCRTAHPARLGTSTSPRLSPTPSASGHHRDRRGGSSSRRFGHDLLTDVKMRPGAVSDL